MNRSLNSSVGSEFELRPGCTVILILVTTLSPASRWTTVSYLTVLINYETQLVSLTLTCSNLEEGIDIEKTCYFVKF